MIVVTGGAGFIGSNIVKGLNNLGRSDILVVDDLTDGTKFRNIVDCKISDYKDKDIFLEKIIKDGAFGERIDAIFHLGACSTTTEWNGRYMMQNNFQYSKAIFHFCLEERIPLIYASSAAIYGGSSNFSERAENEKPLNVYGYSKLLFDQYVKKFLPNPKIQVVGLRYFNVYGPGEQHKGTMASVIYHFNNQLKKHGKINLFKGADGYADGEQKRDFVFVDDVVKANLWFWQHRAISGIYNFGTGEARSFNEVAKAIIEWHGTGKIEYVPFPDNLQGCYQSFTEADLNELHKAGYQEKFTSIKSGVSAYLDYLNS